MAEPNPEAKRKSWFDAFAECPNARMPAPPEKPWEYTIVSSAQQGNVGRGAW